MTYPVLHIRHGKDMQERACAPRQCRTRASASARAPGIGCRDSRETFWRDFPTGLPLSGVSVAELSSTGDSGRKSGSNGATPRRANQPPARTSPAARSVAKRLRGGSTILRTGQGEVSWVRAALNSALFSPTSQTVFICTNCGKHISCSCRQCRPVRSRTT